MNKDDFKIIIDSREQLPFKWGPMIEERGTLKTGDYSIKGYENEIGIERKSVADLCSTILRDRKRFEKEVIRGSKFKYFAVVVEGRTQDIISHIKKQFAINKARGKKYRFSNVGGQIKSVFNTLYHWSVKYCFGVFLCDDKLQAKNVTYELLRAYDKYKKRGDIK